MLYCISQYTGGTWAGNIGTCVTEALANNATVRLRLEVSGAATTALKLYVNNVIKVNATDNTFPITAAGRVGLMDGEPAITTANKTATVGLKADNFLVTPRAADSKGSNTGDYKNSTTLGAAGALVGDPNTAAQFDGVDDYVQMTGTTGIPVGSASRSVEAWFKTSSSARQVIFEYGSLTNTQEFGLWIDIGGTTMTAWGGATATTNCSRCRPPSTTEPGTRWC